MEKNTQNLVNLSLYAYKYGALAAQTKAKKEGLIFDIKKTLKHIKAFYGESEANLMESIWNQETNMDLKNTFIDSIVEKASQESLKKENINLADSIKIDSTLSDKAKQILDLLKSKKQALIYHVQYSYEQMINVDYSTVALRNDADTSLEETIKIIPKVTTYNGEVIISLATNNNIQRKSLCLDKSKYVLFINKEYIEEFDVEKNDDLTDLVAKFPEGLSTEQPCSVRYGDNLDLVAVFIGEEPDFLSEPDIAVNTSHTLADMQNTDAENKYTDIIEYIKSLPSLTHMSIEVTDYVDQLQQVVNDKSYLLTGATAHSDVVSKQWLELTAQGVDGRAFAKIIANKYYAFEITLDVAENQQDKISLIQFSGKEVLIFELTLDFDKKAVISESGRTVGSVSMRRGKVILTINDGNNRLDSRDCQMIAYLRDMPKVLLSVRYGDRMYSFEKLG